MSTVPLPARQRLFDQFRQLPGLVRFSHTVFALPFALLSAAIAWTRPDSPFRWVQLLGIVLCMVCARTAAMAFNRLVDRRIDALNPRTASRHLPAGRVSVAVALGLTLVSAAGFVASTLLFWPNPWPLWLSGPVLLWLLGYSLTKRFTSLCHYWLGAALMLAPIAAWIAIRGSLAPEPLWLAMVVCLWVGGFDILYACQDVEFDRAQGLSSIPARLGVRGALRVAAFSHALATIALCRLAWSGDFGWVFQAAVVGVALLLCYEHAIVREDDLSRINVAFFHVNTVISLGLLAAGVIDLWLVR